MRTRRLAASGVSSAVVRMSDTFDNEVPASTPIERVAWTRGKGCFEIADLLADGSPIRIEDDLGRSCMRDRIDTLVSRKLTSFDLVPIVVPHDVQVPSITCVTAAVGGGPHSPFAVSVAARLGATLGVPVTALSVRDPESSDEDADARLEQLTGGYDEIETRMIEGKSTTVLVDALDPTTLLVVGAPGGSWFQRQIFGPGHRLQVGAPAGALTVRSAPRRCFHLAVEMRDGVVGAEMSAADARRVVRYPVVSVAHGGELVGVVRSRDLDTASDAAPVRTIMDRPVFVDAAEPATVLAEVAEFFEGGPIPVVDGSHRIVGMIAAPEPA